MKRSFLFALIVILLALAMTACGGTSSSGSDDGSLAAGGGNSDLPSGGDGPLEDGLSEEQADAIASALDSTSYEYDADGQTLTVTTSVTEEAINEAIDQTVEAAGYGSADVDLVSGGMVVTISDFTYEGTNYGDVVVSADVSASACEVDVTITSVSVDGTELPDDVVGQINDAFNEAWDSAVDSVLSSADLPDFLDVCVTDVSVSDSDAAVTIVFSW